MEYSFRKLVSPRSRNSPAIAIGTHSAVDVLRAIKPPSIKGFIRLANSGSVLAAITIARSDTTNIFQWGAK